MYNAVVLDPRDILQADATVIAGILILITILYTLSSSDSNKAEVIKTRKRLSIVTLSIITPFSASAVLQLICPQIGKLLMGVGFVVLVVGVAVLLFSTLTVRIIGFRGCGA
jgi:DMSO/TMAO reductase YedYZ heme-binding membrane subunit